MGAHCDLCKPGFFNLQESNTLGCTSCFCFGVSDVCESSGLSIGQVKKYLCSGNSTILHAYIMKNL